MIRLRRLLLSVAAPIVLAATFAATPDEGRRLYTATRPGEQSCASCHGFGGDGGSEGGVVIPAIAGAGGSPATLCRAVRDGRGRDGRALSRSMPRRSLDDGDCVALWRYLADDDGPPPGVEADRFVVRLDTPAAAGPRWRDTLAAEFAAINRAGGVYGRRLDLASSGDAAIRLSLARAGGDGRASITIGLATDGKDPTRRGIESPAAVEIDALLGEIARRGTRSVVSTGDGATAALAEAVVRHGLTDVEPTACGDRDTALVLYSTDIETLSPACIEHPSVYVLLRHARIDRVADLLRTRPRDMPITVVTPMPPDRTVAPALLARIVTRTAQGAGSRVSHRRLLVAFDAAWTATADNPRTLFNGVSLQLVTLPDLAPVGAPRWIDE